MTAGLTVCCVLVDGPVKGFSVDYVVRMHRMVRRYLSRPFRFVCLTDGTRGPLPAPIETIRIPSCGQDVPANGRGYWAKLQVFNRTNGLEGRVLYLDLDTMPVAPLDPIVDFPASLALTTDAFVVERAHLDTDRYGRKLVRRFNSSVMVWDASQHPGGLNEQLFDTVEIADMLRLSTDQDWIGEQAEWAKGMPLEWFPRLSKIGPPETWRPEFKVILTKKPKNHDAVTRFPWFNEWWGGWAA
jgi:hypothetical protein